MFQDSAFLGKGWSFPPTFNKDIQTVEIVEKEVDIVQSLHILLTTRLGERMLQPYYGCDMERLLFEPLDTTMETYMQDLIETAILWYEPRIKLEKVSLTPAVTEGWIDIAIDFIIKTTNSRHNFVYPFYQNEGIEIHEL
jgi:uncharacterized protein